MPSRNRGRRKPKLRDLSDIPLSYDEKIALIDALGDKDHPIATAVLGAVMVEHDLDDLLRKRCCRRKDDDLWEVLVSDVGPFATFNAKIIMGYALRLYDNKTSGDLHSIRKIRNAFAHSKRLIDFNNPLVLVELRQVTSLNRRWKKLIKEDPIPPGVARNAYISFCLAVQRKLMDRDLAAIRASTRRYEKKAARSPFFGLGALGLLPQSGLGVSSLMTLARQSGDPTSESPKGILGGLLQSAAKDARNKDKKS